MLSLPSTLTQFTATDCLRDLSDALGREPAAVVVDAARLVHFDSVALAVLLALRRESLLLGKTFTIANMAARLTDLARLYGIAELLRVHQEIHTL